MLDLLLLAVAVAQALPATRVGAPPAPRGPTDAAAVTLASAPLGDGSTVDLSINGDVVWLRMRGGRYDGKFMSVSTVNDALVLLADRRAEPLWPALLAWAGPGLERLRDIRLASARVIATSGATYFAGNTAESTTRPKTRATMLFADQLAKAGQMDKAIEVIRAARGSAPGRGGWNEVEWMALSTRLTTLTRARDGIPAALAILDASERLLGSGNPYAVNFQINRAAYLAEAGRPVEALAALDRAEAAFQTSDDGVVGEGREKVPGSDRQFAWIRICALTQLGRGAEVQPLMDRIYPVAEPRDYDFIVPASESIRLRLFRCTNDAASMAREYARELRQGPLGGAALLLLQPEYHAPSFDPAFMERVAAEPEMKSTLAGRLRPLPPSLVPALNQWRGNPQVIAAPTP